MISKWIRHIHRWAVFPFTIALIVGLLGGIIQGPTFQIPSWLGLIGALSLVTMGLTSLYLFVQYYWAILRRAKRTSSP